MNENSLASVNAYTSTIFREAVVREDTFDIKKILDSIKVGYSGKHPFNDHKELYIHRYQILQSLIKRTLNWSIFTSLVIVFCLSIIPFADFILKQTFILYLTFCFVVACIGIIFIGLIYILKKALYDS